MGKVYLTGAGPGDFELMTIKALRVIQEADIIIYDRLANPDILKEAKKDIELKIVLGNRTSLVQIQSNNGRILGGLRLSAINADIQKQFRLAPETKGLLISDVAPKSKAEKAGFQAGDIIIQIEDIEIKNFNNIESSLTKYKNKHKRVYVNRYGQTILLVIK